MKIWEHDIWWHRQAHHHQRQTHHIRMMRGRRERRRRQGMRSVHVELLCLEKMRRHWKTNRKSPRGYIGISHYIVLTTLLLLLLCSRFRHPFCLLPSFILFHLFSSFVSSFFSFLFISRRLLRTISSFQTDVQSFWFVCRNLSFFQAAQLELNCEWIWHTRCSALSNSASLIWKKGNLLFLRGHPIAAAAQ